MPQVPAVSDSPTPPLTAPGEHLKPLPLPTLLRDRTATAHRQLEEALALHGTGLELARYVRIVAAFDRFLRGWEPRMLTALGPRALPIFVQRRHTPRTRADLDFFTARLGQAKVDAYLAGMPATCGELPELHDGPCAWGSAYVIEGSTLGGKFITREITARLGFTASAGASYFAGYGADTGAMWTAFRDALVVHVHAADHDTTVRAADETFGALHRWMERCSLT